MFRTILVVVPLAIFGVHAHACSVTYSSSADSVKKAIKNGPGWDFENYDAICEKLNRANVKLEIDGAATVLGGKSISWAVVNLRDKNLPIVVTDFGGSATSINDIASMDKAESMLMESINSAINSVNIDKALKLMETSRQKIKASYKK